MKISYTNQCKFIIYGTIYVYISEHKIATNLELKNYDRLLVSSVFGPEFGPKRFTKSGPNPARLTVQSEAAVNRTITTEAVGV